MQTMNCSEDKKDGAGVPFQVFEGWNKWNNFFKPKQVASLESLTMYTLDQQKICCSSDQQK